MRGFEWLVQRALNMATTKLPDVDKLRSWMLGIDEHQSPSVRFFKAPDAKAWIRFEPWMTSNVDLDTWQVPGWSTARTTRESASGSSCAPLEWRLCVQVVAIDPSAVFRGVPQGPSVWLPRAAVSMDAFHLVLLGNDMLTEVRRAPGPGNQRPARTHHRPALSRCDTLGPRPGPPGLCRSSNSDDPTSKLRAAWNVKEQLRVQLRTGSLQDAAAAKTPLQELVEIAAQPETDAETAPMGRPGPRA